MKNSSTWTALSNPVFRRLWFATLISGTCVAAHDTAATWTMNMLTDAPLLLSLMSTLASLPFFLFTLPAGAPADIVDHKGLMYAMNIWLAVSAGGLAMCGWLHLLNPYILLGGVFLIGVGFAFNAPAWTAIQPEIVSNDELPSAATLGGLQLNISGIRARGRMNAIVIMAAQGSLALGGVVWGSSASIWGIPATLLGAAAVLLTSLLLLCWLSIDFTRELDFEPAAVSGACHKFIHLPQPHDGLVAITFEFEVDRTRGKEFIERLREVRLIHLRNGAFSWRQHEDLDRLNTYRVELMVPSWTEYLLSKRD